MLTPNAPASDSTASIESLLEQVRGLKADAIAQEGWLSSELARLHENFHGGGRNFAHYLAVRQHDLRALQRDLARLGLCSLGRMESCVLPTLEAVERDLEILLAAREGRGFSVPPSERGAERGIVTIDLDGPEARLRENSTNLLGPPPHTRETRIMVTLPMDASASLIERLVEGGASVLRINCAKGNALDWERTVERVRSTERKLARSCRVLCDLAGPNPRTLVFESQNGGKRWPARVSPGDRLYVARDAQAGERLGVRVQAPVIGFTLPEVLDDIAVGERVFYDDASLIAVVRELDGDGALLEVTFTRKPRLKLKAEKTVNFPDTELSLPSLTERDLVALDFIAGHADMVGFSFVRSPDDVEFLQKELSRRAERSIGIVLKIETTQAFNRLPRLLFTAMRSAVVGVMVARGDMAVELGFVRLAEAQEEVLWMCEAALVPAIWATQVLENLNKNGVPSRAEVTDAAMSGRAECVMLNRGEHILEALTFLSEVLERMHEHQEKKRSMLRKLRLAKIDY